MEKNGRSQQPDWSKFGLDNEKRPLTSVQTQSNDLYGGQPQMENELFAEDQGSTSSTPWWFAHFLVSERVLFGTWDGVFTSCLINIFGVIVFLRSGWIVAEAGIGHAAIIVLFGVTLILIAVLSAIGICQRCQVQSGGVYFLVSHVLGARRGAAVGLIYVLGQAIGNALCATGFGESISGLFGENHSAFLERSIAALIILILTLINVAGVKWVIRLQSILLLILLMGVVDFGIGSFSHQNIEAGFMGWNWTIWRNNSQPGYTEHHNWFSVFGVFFPALTGVMAGINMSGDLKNPSQDISVGTLSAVATASCLYLFFMVVLAGTCDRNALLTNYMITEKVSAVGVFILAALYISTVSSSLATLYGTPRVLQSIASENVIPFIARLSDGRGPNKVPVNSLCVISLVTLLFIFIGEMNRLATLATMPYLMTYAAIEYSYFALSQQFDKNRARLEHFRAHGIASSPTFESRHPAQPNSGHKKHHRDSLAASSAASDDAASSVDGDSYPERKARDEEFEELLEKYNVDEIEEMPQNTFYSPFCNRWISLSGFVMKIILMLLIHWGYALLCMGLCVMIWWFIGDTGSAAHPGVAVDISATEFARSLAHKLSRGHIGHPKRDQFVITPMHPSVQTKPSQLNDVNTDFASRSQFHHISQMTK